MVVVVQVGVGGPGFRGVLKRTFDDGLLRLGGAREKKNRVNISSSEDDE